MKKNYKVWYCKYDGYFVIKKDDRHFEVIPFCMKPELMDVAIEVNAFSYEFVTRC